MAMVRAALIIIGTEITSGISTDSNSPELSAYLSSNGYNCGLIVQVPDNLDAIAEAIKEVSNRFQLSILTGGLGSTHDDLTREAIVKATGRELIEDSELRSRVSRWIPAGADMTLILKQAQLPAGSIPILAGPGTAPGIFLDTGDCVIVALPGVPSEMRSMLPMVFGHLEKRFPDRTILNQRIFKIFGPGEPQVAKVIAPIIESYKDVEFIILASAAEIKLILSVSDSEGLLTQQLEAAVKRVSEELGDAIFGREDIALEKVVGVLLEQNEVSVSVAESCTGGLIAEKLTRIPGCSAYFRGGIVSYHDETKISVLGVARETLETKGAVSEDTALEMAAGALKSTGSDIALAVTGIAGPGGGTIDKPVGLVFIALVTTNMKFVRRYEFKGNRDSIRIRSAQSALDLLRLWLIGRLTSDVSD